MNDKISFNGIFKLGIYIEFLHLCFPGTTPGPVLPRFIIDSACTIWQNNCGKTGSRWSYKKHDLGMRIMIWWLIHKAIGVIFVFTAFKLYKPPLEYPQEVEINTIQYNFNKEETKL